MKLVQAGYFILNHIAFIDGKVTPREADMVREYLNNNFHGSFNIIQEAERFTEKSIRGIRKKLETGYKEAFQFFSDNANNEKKKELFNLILRLVEADGPKGAALQHDLVKSIALDWKMDIDMNKIFETEATTVPDDNAAIKDNSFQLVMEIAREYAEKYKVKKGKKSSLPYILIGLVAIAIIIVLIIILT